ncbi:MAG: hypothetical protein N3A72_11120 [bacterium]|nr:hypothetical protein [bacterium]
MAARITFLTEEAEPKPVKSLTRLNSLLAEDDIICPVSDDAKNARVKLQTEYQIQKDSFLKAKSVVNATNLFICNHLRLPRRV